VVKYFNYYLILASAMKIICRKTLRFITNLFIHLLHYRLSQFHPQINWNLKLECVKKSSVCIFIKECNLTMAKKRQCLIFSAILNRDSVLAMKLTLLRLIAKMSLINLVCLWTSCPFQLKFNLFSCCPKM
jgi:hypothetical protein